MNPKSLQAKLKVFPSEEMRVATGDSSPQMAASAVGRDSISPAKATPKRGRTLPNLASNLGSFALGLIITVWLTPYLIHNLSTASYGLIPLVSQITGYMIVFTAVFNSVVGRYVTMALEQGDNEGANHFFNSALFGNLFGVLLLIVPVGLATWRIDSLIVIPAGQVTQARWLFACTVAAFFLGTIQSPFGISTFYTNRLDLRSAISVLQQIAKVALIISLFSLLQPQIWQVGLATMLSMCFGWGWTFRFFRRLTPTLRVSIYYFRLSALRSLLSTGGWISFNQIGGLLFLAIDLILVNRLFGAEAGGRYAVALQASVFLRTIAGVIAGVFGPTIFYLFARHEIDALVAYSRRAVRILGIAMALPIGLICGLSKPLLTTWVGPEFADLAPLMSLLTIHLSVNLAVHPLFNVQTATDKVRWPAVMTCAMGLVNLGLAVYLAGHTQWGGYGVAIAGAVALTSKNLLFTPLYAAHALGCRLGVFFRGIVATLGATIGTALVGLAITLAWHPSGWLQLALAGLAVTIGYAVVAFWVLLNAEDRRVLRNLLAAVSRSDKVIRFLRRMDGR